jgi:outer membrane protein assembly factor BamB
MQHRHSALRRLWGRILLAALGGAVVLPAFLPVSAAAMAALPAAVAQPLPLDGNATIGLSTWPAFQGGGNLSGLALSAGPVRNATLWSAYAGRAPPSPLSALPEGPGVVVENGTLFVASGQDGVLLAMNSSTGSLLWTRSLGEPIYGTPLVAGSRVFVGLGDPTSGGGAVVALNTSTGTPVWQSSPAPLGPLLGSLNLVDGLVLAAGSGGYVYAWNASTGLETYHLALPGPSYAAVSVASPQDPLALASVPGQGVYAYGAVNGTAAPWSPFVASEPVYASALQGTYVWEPSGPSRPVEVPIAIVADNGGNASVSQVYVVATGLTGLAAAGTVLATYSTLAPGGGFDAMPAWAGEVGGNLSLVLQQVNGSLLELHFAVSLSGIETLVPVFDLPPPAVSSSLSSAPPLISSGIAYVAPGPGVVEAVGLANGTVHWKSPFPSPVVGSLALASGRLYALGENGTLVAFGPAVLPPSATELLISETHPYWTAAGATVGLSVSLERWFSNGSTAPAAGARVAATTTAGVLYGSPGTTAANGTAELSYSAPSVPVGVNVTFNVTAQDGTLRNGSSFVVVVVPVNDTHSTPLTLSPTSPLPSVLLSGGFVRIPFQVAAGPGGGSVTGAAVTFSPFGGAVSPTRASSSTNGSVAAIFTAENTATVVGAGVSLLAEYPGYPSGSYTWDVLVDPLPALVVTVMAGASVMVAGGSTNFTLRVTASDGENVSGAFISLTPPVGAGNETPLSGYTDLHGNWTFHYEAPRNVPSPGQALSIPYSVLASGFPATGGFLALSVVPPPRPPSSPGPSGPLSGLGTVGGWALLGALAAVAALALFEGLLLLRPRRPPRPSVWEDWENSEGREPRSPEQGAESAGTPPEGPGE